MAAIAAFICTQMLAQVERNNRRSANRLLSEQHPAERSGEATSCSIENTLNTQQYARLLQKDSSLKELLITEEFFAEDERRGRLTKARGKLESMVRGRDHVKWSKVQKVLLQHRSLKILEIHYMGFENDKWLCRVLERMPQLTHLTLYGNEMGDSGACMLARALATSKTTLLTCLVLDSNNILDDGAIHLATALSSNRTLLYLSLKHNYIKTAGAIALARAIGYNSTCERLDLSHNFVHAAGAIALAAALAHNSRLKELNLSYNDNELALQCIGDAGAKAFGTALARNSTLEILKLTGNHIGPTGCAALAAGLANNTCLKELHLDNNSIGMEGFVALCKALEKNKSLQVLSLQGVVVPNERASHKALLQALEHNMTLLHVHFMFLCKECIFYLSLNQGLHKILRDEECPSALWPRVLERASKERSAFMRVNMMFYAIQQKSELFIRR